MKATYPEILALIKPNSLLSYIDNKIAAYLVYQLQFLPFTANAITVFSFLLVLGAIYFLLILDFKLIFIFFLILAYTFDNMDGIWARLKKQSSEFGAFFDGFMDAVKYFAIDLALIVYYFDNIQKQISSDEALVLLFSIFFIIRGLFYSSYFHETGVVENKRLKIFALANQAERYCIILPLVILRTELFFIYIFGSLLMYFLYIFIYLSQRYRYKPNI